MMQLGNDFLLECLKHKKGTIIEFGTLTGSTAIDLANYWKPENGKVITIDGWKGLPKSEKEIPENWHEGAFTGKKHEVEKLLSIYENVVMIDSWINELEPPESYNIGPVVGAHIDVDIYESTVDSLNYLDRCEWVNNEVVIRFDDWAHNRTPEVARKVKLHNQLAYSEFLERTRYISTEIISTEFCAVFNLKRK